MPESHQGFVEAVACVVDVPGATSIGRSKMQGLGFRFRV